MIAGLFFFLVLAVILDLRTFRIPNALTMAGMAVGVIYQLYRAGPPGMFGAVKDFFGSILILFPLYMIKCLGAGDIKLLSVITIFLGWKQGMIISIYSLFAGAAIGIIKGSILFAFRRKKSANQRIFVKSKGKGVIFYFAGKAAKTAFLAKIKIIKEVAGRLQKNFARFLRPTKVDKNRQKERNHIEQIRTANQLIKSNKRKESKDSKDCNKKDQIGVIDQSFYYLNEKDQLNQSNQLNLLIYNSQKIQFISTNHNSLLNYIIRRINSKKQQQYKQQTGDQGCVIHYSIAILIAFLIARLS